jgi:hypothetical protein
MLFVALCVSYARSPALLRFITASSTSCELPISERSLPGILLLWGILLLLCSGVVQSVRKLMRCLPRPESQFSLCVVYLATLRCGDPAAALEVAAFESQSCSLLNCISPACLLSLVVLHAYAIQAKAERLPLLRLSCTCCVKQGHHGPESCLVSWQHPFSHDHVRLRACLLELPVTQSSFFCARNVMTPN